VEHILSVLRQRGEPYGLEFGDLVWLSNSRLSLEAAEFARAQGRYHDLHGAIFRAYFTDGKDIGDMAVLRELAHSIALDGKALETALDEGTYSGEVSAGSDEARERGVTAVPAFFIEDLPVITGAVHEDVFRKALRSVAEK